MDPSLIDGPQLAFAARYERILTFDINEANNWFPLTFADLPEPMRPWVVPKVYGDGPPQAGNWRQNQFVTARPVIGNATQSAVMGWLCVSSGEPGSWAAITPQHAAEGVRPAAKSDDDESLQVVSEPLPFNCTCTNGSLCLPLSTPLPAREIFPFIAGEPGGGDDPAGDPAAPSALANNSWAHFRWDVITTAAWGFGGAEHVCWAHEHGARVVVPASAAAFDSAGQAQLTAMLLNATARAAWVQSVISDIQSHGADGVTLDIEGNNQHADKLTMLVSELRTALLKINPVGQLSFCTQAMPAIANLTCHKPLRECLAKSHGPSLGYAYADLAEHIDFFVRSRVTSLTYALIQPSELSRAAGPDGLRAQFLELDRGSELRHASDAPRYRSVRSTWRAA